MKKPELLLRVFQINCIVFVLLWVFVLSHFQYHKTQGAITFGQWLVVLFAVYSAVGGFFGQRLMARARYQQQRSIFGSVPLDRWFTGHLIRLSGAVAVCLSALGLHMIGGPAWLVNVIFCLGMILLLIWKPGARPTQTEL